LPIFSLLTIGTLNSVLELHAAEPNGDQRRFRTGPTSSCSSRGPAFGDIVWLGCEALDQCIELSNERGISLYRQGVGKRLYDDWVGAELFEVLKGQIEGMSRSIECRGGDLRLLSLPTSNGGHAFRMRQVPDCSLNSG
jgi:hypothetical protein